MMKTWRMKSKQNFFWNKKNKNWFYNCSKNKKKLRAFKTIYKK